MKVITISEYLSKSADDVSVTEFKLSKHYAYPLKKQDLLNEHDPVAYITGMMTKLQSGELISFQIVVSPTKRKDIRRTFPYDFP